MKTTNWYKVVAIAQHDLRVKGFLPVASFENKSIELAYWQNPATCEVSFLTNWKTIKDDKNVLVETWESEAEVHDFHVTGAKQVWREMVINKLDLDL